MSVAFYAACGGRPAGPEWMDPGKMRPEKLSRYRNRRLPVCVLRPPFLPPVLLLPNLHSVPGDCLHARPDHTVFSGPSSAEPNLSLQQLTQLPPRIRLLPLLRPLPSLSIFSRQSRHARKTSCPDALQGGPSR